MIGETVGNYRITDLLSKGGMGAVYIAVHVQIGRKAAVKVLLPAFSDRPDSVQRFFAEARATASIGHPGIVEIFDFGRLENGDTYLIMELLEGEPLTRRLSVPMPVARSLALMEHITSALDAAHAKGIVHRDLKPNNIILVSDPGVRFGERTKLLDFGIAKLTDDELGRDYATKTGMIMGTPAYMAPEQCRGASNVDQRADLYALGCILFHMVCARPPFQGFGAGEIIGMQQFVPPPRPRTLNPDIPLAVESLILRLLEKDPRARLQSTEALLAELAVLTPNASGQDADGWSLQSRRASSQRPPSSRMRKLDRTGERTLAAGESSLEPTGSLPEIDVIERPVAGAPPPVFMVDTTAQAHGMDGDPPTTLNSAVHATESAPPPAPSRRWRMYAAGLMLAGSLGLVGWLGLMPSGGAHAPVRAAGEPGVDSPGSRSAAMAIGSPSLVRDPVPGSGISGGEASLAQPATSPASAPRPATVTITSEPEDASVYLGEQKLGHTPLADHPVPEGSQDIVLTVKKRGYRDKEVRVQPGQPHHVRMIRLGQSARNTGAAPAGASETTRSPETQRPQHSQGVQDPNGTIDPFPR